MPGVRGHFEEAGKALAGVPEGPVERRGHGSVRPGSHRAHIAVASLPHHMEDALLANEAASVAARRGQAGHWAGKGVFDQFFRIDQLAL